MKWINLKFVIIFLLFLLLLILYGNSHFDNGEITVRPLKDGQYLYSYQIYSSPFQQKRVYIHADDCFSELKINGVTPTLFYKGFRYCNYEKYYDFDFSPYLKVGENRVSVVVTNTGSAYNFSFIKNPSDPILIVYITLFVLVLFIFFYLLLKRRNFSKLVIVIFLFAIIFRFLYFSYTDYSIRGYDTEGHVEYIERVTKDFQIPSSSDCWQCYQPPLYYLINASLVKVFNFFGTNNTNAIFTSLQISSIFLSLLTLYFGLLILNLFLRGKRLEFAFAIISLSLITIIHSTRISNDILQYLFATITLYFLSLYYLKSIPSYLLFSILFSVLSIASKQNSLVLIPILLLTLFLAYFKHKDKKRLFTHTILSLILLLIAIVSINLPSLTNSQGKKDFLIGNITGLNYALKVGNNLENYIYFDLNSYLTFPNISPWEDKGGRQYVFNYLLKTAQFGEFKFTNDSLSFPINLSSISLLITILLSIIKLCFYRLKNIAPLVFPLAIILLFLSSLFFLRYRYPYSADNDFRFILPSLPFFSLLYALLIPKSVRFLKLVYIFPIVFLIFSSLAILFLVFITPNNTW